MNLVSCDNCGVVLDKDKLPFPEDCLLPNYEIDHTKACWNGAEYVAFCQCPVCKHTIMEKEAK